MLSAAGLVSVCVGLRLTATTTAIGSPIFGNRARELVPRVGFEPTAYRLRSGCSTAELSGQYRSSLADLIIVLLRPSQAGRDFCSAAVESGRVRPGQHRRKHRDGPVCCKISAAALRDPP